MRQQKIRHTLVSIDLILHSRKSVPFVLIDLGVHGPAALLDRVHHLLRFRFRTARIMSPANKSSGALI